MAKHLSVRLPWHDRGWDGHVCDRPTANVFCTGEYGLKAHGIREKKVDEDEEAIAGKLCHSIKKGCYMPPCLRTIQTFGGTKSLPWLHEPKEFLSTEDAAVSSIPEDIAPFTAGTWGYDQVFRRNAPTDDTPDEFQDRFSPQEARKNIEGLFGQAKLGRSLAFYYLNYDNPVNSERRRYVLVGAAEIAGISKQLEWHDMDADRAAKYGTFVWNRFITSGYGDGKGARLPYDAYIRTGADLSDIAVEIPLELSQHFKYACRSFTDDEAAIFLMQLIEAMERGKAAGAVDWPWDQQIAWLKGAYARVLKDRGPFPGLGSVLDALGFNGGAVYVERHASGKGVLDARKHVIERIAHPEKAEDASSKKGFSSVQKTLKLLPDGTQRLLLDRLCLFELSEEQVKLIAGSGLVPEEDRAAVGLVSNPTEILDNPYRIVEEFDPVDHEDRILFYRIDNGIFLAKQRAETSVPGLDTYEPEDPRRLRAAIFQLLHDAAAEGHSFLLQDVLLSQITKLKLPGVSGHLGAVTLAKDLELYEQIFTIRKEQSLVAWQLKTVAEDEEVIRERVRKLRQRTPQQVQVKDWSKYLPKADPKIAEAEVERARVTQVDALQRLAKQPFSVLVGGAGTGKTSVLAALIRGVTEARGDEKFLLLAPTGKAAVRLEKRVREVSGLDVQPRTIHSFLSTEGWIDWNTWRPLRDGNPVSDGSTTVIIDECSMLDLTLLATVIRALDWRTVRRLILCGDPQQLPPIGLGAPFKNMVDALQQSDQGSACICALTVNCRQLQEKSSGLRLAELFTDRGATKVADEFLDEIRSGGKVPPDLEVHFFKDEFDLPDKLNSLFTQIMDDLLVLEKAGIRVKQDRPYEAFNLLHGFNGKGPMRLDAVEVISPYRGNYFGADAFNAQLQSLLRGGLLAGRNMKLGKPSGRQYVDLDKVLQIQNVRGRAKDKVAWEQGKDNVDYFVANGELGKLVFVKYDKYRRERYGKVLFETSPSTWIRIDGQWAETMLDLGYAITVHKAQGSDFSAVLLVIPKEERQRLVSRELLYTALTRFTKRLYLLIQGEKGDVGPLMRCLWRGSSAYLQRNTSLYTLQQAIPDLDDYLPEKRIHRTLRGELVASKSELLISTRLAEFKVPYYYERPLVAPDGSFRLPDFTIPVENPDPDVLYWEHWGMRGDPAYETSMKKRREWYEKHGFLEKLIETDEVGGFDVPKIDRIIRDRLLP